MRNSQMRKYDSAIFIELNSRLEQHSATILKFASFVHFVYTKTTINIHMRIFQMGKYDSAIFMTLNFHLVQHSATFFKFESFLLCFHKNNDKYSYENFPNEKIGFRELYYT